MKPLWNCFLLASLLMLGTCEAQGPSPDPTPSACEGLSAFTLRDITITSARLVGPSEFVPPAGPGGGPGGPGGGRSGRPGAPPDAPGATVKAQPAFCRVAGVGSPHIAFEVWLPAPPRPGPWNARLGVLTLVWGFNWIIVAVALRDFGPWSFRAISLGIAVATMFVISRLRRESLAVPKNVHVRLLFAGAFNIAIWNVATAYAVMLIPSGHAAVIAFSMPLWGPPSSAFCSWASGWACATWWRWASAWWAWCC